MDTWNERVVGGCTYHVVHPGGRSYDDSPVNAFAAESRRLARFWSFGYGEAGGRVKVAETGRDECSPEYPYTLDMRR